MTADELVRMAMAHVGERYVLGADVPMDDANWTGPWDCAEFASWLAFQATGQAFGWTDNSTPVRQAEPFSGAWARDASALAASEQLPLPAGGLVRGAFLIRRPRPERVGHVAVARGDGTTIEAMDTQHGVTVGQVGGRRWDIAIKLPGVTYP